MYLTMLVDGDASLVVQICAYSELSVVDLSVEPTHSIDWDMAHKIHFEIWEMYHTLFDGFPGLLSTSLLPPSFKLDQGEGELHLVLHLLKRCDCINHSLELIHNAVCISDTPGGSFSLRMDRQTLNSTCLLEVSLAALWTSSAVAVFSWARCLANVLLGPVASVRTSGNNCGSWCRNHLSNSLCLTGVTRWILCSTCSFTLNRSASAHLVATCWAQFNLTWHCLRFVVGTLSALFTWISIAAWMVSIFWSWNWWNSVANSSSSLDFAPYDIAWSHKAPRIEFNGFRASSSAVRDWSELFYWLTRRESCHNGHTAPIAISSEAVSTAVFLSSLEHSRIGL